MYQAIAQNDFNSLQEAVEQGALINANDHFGHSPLHYAAYKGNSRFVDFLLRNGGNPNARSKHLSTPLHSAAWGRNLKVAEILLEDGADVNAETDEGETPAMTAALRGEKTYLKSYSLFLQILMLKMSMDPTCMILPQLVDIWKFLKFLMIWRSRITIHSMLLQDAVI